MEQLKFERDVVIEKKTKNELVIKVYGEGHTLGNLIAKLASKEPHVLMAIYQQEHPLEPSVKIIIRTDGKRDPVDVLISTTKKVEELAERFIQELG